VRRAGNRQQFARALDQRENENLKKAQHDGAVCLKDFKMTTPSDAATLFFPAV
jgi:hypothetical protein